jgi:hypothetical protein
VVFITHGALFLFWLTIAKVALTEFALLRLYLVVKKRRNLWKTALAVIEMENFIKREIVETMSSKPKGENL